MNLANLIQTIDEWQSKTAAEVAAELNSATVEVRDDQLYTWAGVALLIDSAGAEGLRVALEANGAGWAVHQLGGSGIQLSHPSTQAFLNAFSAAGVPGCDVLAATGIHYESPYKRAGGAGDVTEAEVQDALDAIAAQDDADSLQARITNAAALANERLAAADDKAAAWAQCWEDAV